MAKVVWQSGIEYVSGALCKCGKKEPHKHGRMLLATHRKAATTSDSCNRIYLRQLSLENKDTDDILKRFHALLDHYFREGKQLQKGLPTVAYCASELAYSSRYFGDLVHKATGGTAIGYIHAYVIKQAKSLLMNGHNVSETSTLLGFEYPHHFTRLFKRMVGMTPTEFLKK